MGASPKSNHRLCMFIDILSYPYRNHNKFSLVFYDINYTDVHFYEEGIHSGSLTKKKKKKQTNQATKKRFALPILYTYTGSDRHRL